MLILAAHLWTGLLAAALIGLAAALLRRPAIGTAWIERIAVGGALLAFVALLVVSVLALVPGETGLWLDSALLHAASYLIGYLAGALLRSLLVRQVAEPGRAVAR